MASTNNYREYILDELSILENITEYYLVVFMMIDY